MKKQEINRDSIVELISDNRLQEALQSLEKVTRGTHLHNQVVVLSSSYAEYSQLNRNATQDFQTLEMQRTRISNSLLSFLDELSPDDYDSAVQTPQPAKQTVMQQMGDNKKWLYVGGGVLLVFILIAVFSNGDSDSTTTAEMVLPTQVENTQQNISNENQTTTTPTNMVSAATLQLVEFGNNSQILGVYRQIDAQNWVEKSYSAENKSFNFNEVQRDDYSVYLHDPKRDIDIQLDLHTRTIKYSDKNKSHVEIYKIINAQ